MKMRLFLIAIIPVLLLVPIVAMLRYIATIATNPQKAMRIAIGHDQLANVAFNGHEDETISSRAYRAMKEKRTWGCVLCKFLDVLEKDHCKKSEGV
jgi:hypothetical protein